MLNEVKLIGHLGKDPELRHTQSGAAVCQFSVATSESYKDNAGNWQTNTEWHNVVAWNDLADRCAKNLRKGSLVFISGKIKTDKYDKDGVTHYSTKVVANVARSLDKKETNQETNGQPSEAAYSDLPF